MEPPTSTPAATPLCDQLKATDNWNPNWEPFYQLDPAWTEKFMDASCTHMYAPGVRRHIRKALELGATPKEITAVLQLTSVLGIHTMSLGAPILQEEMARFEASPQS